MATLAPDRPLGGPASRDSKSAHVARSTTIGADPAAVLDRLKDPVIAALIFECEVAPRLVGEIAGVSLSFNMDDDSDAIDGPMIVTAEEAPGGRGALVRFVLPDEKPPGFFAKILTKFKDDSPDTLVARAARRLKQLIETGEVATAARTRAELIEERN